MDQTYRVGELFSGIGGIGLGFKNAGFEIAWANESDVQAGYTYARNLPEVRLCRKNVIGLEEYDIGKAGVDVLTAGLPYQPFSAAGDRRGPADERGKLFYQLLRLTQMTRPRVVFLESVPNLRWHDSEKTWDIMEKEMADAGYRAKYRVMNAVHFSGIPQNRNRLYAVFFREGNDYRHFEFPAPAFSKPRTVRTYLDGEAPTKYYYTNTKYAPMLEEAMNGDREAVCQIRRTYIRKSKSGLVPTLTANMGGGGHNVPIVRDDRGVRKLTPQECLRLQGFPADFVYPECMADYAKYKQAGNSVSVPVVAAIAENIRTALACLKPLTR
jgi:DNA (cytosine-5)-methyltransferase 1